jgi:hypothetical protein
MAQPDHGIPIQIDHKPYKAPRSPMTGSELRALAQPPITAQYDLWAETRGQGDDVKVEDGQGVAIEPGAHFYTALATINPGACDGHS